MDGDSVHDAADAHRLGYNNVDDNPNVAVLVETMEATGRWSATTQLRSWERRNLALAGNERLLDVGCGLGDAAISLANDLSAEGELVGIDASAAMLLVARSRSTSVVCPVRFSVGDANRLDEPSRTFDVVRSERTLQWLTDPKAAIGEFVRVLRPGGHLSLIDSDWSTFSLDVGDSIISASIREAMRTERHRSSNVGSRLGEYVRASGLEAVVEAEATQVWTEWDPDGAPAPEGCFSMRSLAEDLVARGQLTPSDTAEFVATIHDAARHGRFTMSLTMFAVIASAPS